MMIKRLLLLILAINGFVFAAGFGQVQQQEFLKPEEAFKVTAIEANNSIITTITLGKDIYIYADSLKFQITKPSATLLETALPQSINFHDEAVYEKELKVSIPKKDIEAITNDAFELKISFEGCSKSGVCYQPISESFSFEGKDGGGLWSKFGSLSSTTSVADISQAIQSESFGFIILLFFVVGLLLALTPCIFPMIPILSAIIVSQAGNEKPSTLRAFLTSLVYVLAMSLTYAIVGVVAGLLGFDMQAAMQNPFVLILFAGVFVALAISLFGYYEIGLPMKWQTKLSAISDNAGSKGIIGTAIMGILSALIVGPCVAPALGGAILFISQSGDALLGGTALFVMSMGMGMPLLLVGIGAGKWMPRPGSWMSLVSKFFGVAMLALAIMMISRIVPSTITMILSALLAFGTSWGLYKNRRVFVNFIAKVISNILCILLFALGVVLLIGAFTGGTSTLTPLAHLSSNGTTISSHGRKGYSVEKLMNEIKASNKPVIVDFTKESCAACKELDVITFVDPKVKEAFKEYLFIQVDLTDNTAEDTAMLKHFGVFGTPNILFFNAKGEYLQNYTITGFVSPEKLIKHLETLPKQTNE
ncbi:MAG: protein-disulfide reductase DsbD [Campylobacterales bacterium]|nr:protein-disulfide reductase DsbD [Campylobacterales bacterium]